MNGAKLFVQVWWNPRFDRACFPRVIAFDNLARPRATVPRPPAYRVARELHEFANWPQLTTQLRQKIRMPSPRVAEIATACGCAQ